MGFAGQETQRLMILMTLPWGLGSLDYTAMMFRLVIRS